MSLAEEPLADPQLGRAEGGVEAEAAFEGKEREQPAVGVLPLEHEVDAEDEGGDEIEEVGHPVGEGGEEVRGGGGEGVFGALGEIIDAEPVGQRKALETGDDGRDAGGQVGSELVEVADDGGKSDDEKEDDGEKDGAEQKQDGERARDGMGAAKAEAHDAVDDRHEHDGEERADVDEGEDLAQTPGEGEGQQDSEGEEDMAADGAAGLLGRDGGWGRQGAPPSDEMHIVCIMRETGG